MMDCFFCFFFCLQYGRAATSIAVEPKKHWRLWNWCSA
jgi:hypothetical protein